jgi:hypothetical protein
MGDLRIARSVLGSGAQIHPMYITFTSANNLFVWDFSCNGHYCDIGDYSNVVNPELEKFFSTHYGPYGVVVMDRITPNSNLVLNVVKSNFY